MENKIKNLRRFSYLQLGISTVTLFAFIIGWQFQYNSFNELKKQLQSEKTKESNISAEKGNVKQWEFETDSSSSLIKPPKEETPNIDCNYVEMNPELGFDMIGDGFCDDFLNNDACWFDLGDCCILDEDSLAYCNVCDCYMATATIPSDWITPSVLSQKPEIISCTALNYIDESYLGDGHCDDILNHGNCTFDGGDCCLDNISTDYCTTCTCLETIALNSEACENEAWIGDVICDDGNNNLECHFDGGDCCYEGVEFEENTLADFCTECECKEGSFNIPKLKSR